MLMDIVNLDSGIVLLTGDARRIGRAFMKAWLSRGMTFLAEALPFPLEGFEERVFIGSPFEGYTFDGYLIINPLSRPKAERSKLYEWLKNSSGLVLLYERKYVGGSITRYALRNFIDYLVAYKRETLGFERVEVYRFEEGRAVTKKTYVRRT